MKTRKIIMSRHIIFDECNFPFLKDEIEKVVMNEHERSFAPIAPAVTNLPCTISPNKSST